jgi:hypothetical protein
VGSGGVVLDARPMNLRHRSLRGLEFVLMCGADGLKTGALPLFDRSSIVYAFPHQLFQESVATIIVNSWLSRSLLETAQGSDVSEWRPRRH